MWCLGQLVEYVDCYKMQWRRRLEKVHPVVVIPWQQYGFEYSGQCQDNTWQATSIPGQFKDWFRSLYRRRLPGCPHTFARQPYLLKVSLRNKPARYRWRTWTACDFSLHKVESSTPDKDERRKSARSHQYPESASVTPAWWLLTLDVLRARRTKGLCPNLHFPLPRYIPIGCLPPPYS